MWESSDGMYKVFGEDIMAPKLILVFLLALASAIRSQRIHEIGDIPGQPELHNSGGIPETLPPLADMGIGNLPENVEERSSEYWQGMAQRDLIKRINRKLNLNKAKNIILFIGDGMSIPTLMAARTFKGQLEGKTGEEESLSFEKFPYAGLVKTYCANRQVADSSCTATAYLCGVKGNFFTAGVNAQVRMNNCLDSENPAYHVDSIAKWAQDTGKATGIVTTTTVTNASPSAVYAHTANRAVENDFDIVVQNITGCTDIAKQLITKSPGKNLKVIYGGGRAKLQPAQTSTENGRLDGLDLTKLWQLNNPKGAYITTRKELLRLKYARTEKVLGLFTPGHMNFNSFRTDDEPSLTEMTESAIRLLSRERKGYFLFVEGGRIDHGHHITMARVALEETVEFAKAIERAREMTSESDTLIVVSSDHSHTMTISGYPTRGNDILGLGDMPADYDNLPYATLSYANGPERYLNDTGHRLNLTGLLTPYANYPANVPMSTETHGGDDVAVFASGPHSHLFTGLYEQHFIPHLMAYAACIGKGKTACDQPINEQ